MATNQQQGGVVLVTFCEILGQEAWRCACALLFHFGLQPVKAPALKENSSEKRTSNFSLSDRTGPKLTSLNSQQLIFKQ